VVNLFIHLKDLKQAHAIDIIPDPYKPNKNEDAYLLENGHSINIKLCDIVKDLEK
jgi:hypothetical protein